MKLAKGTTIWDPARILCSLGTTIKPVQIKQRIKLVTIKNSKTQLRYEMKLKFEMNKQNYNLKRNQRKNEFVNLHPKIKRKYWSKCDLLALPY